LVTLGVIASAVITHRPVQVFQKRSEPGGCLVCRPRWPGEHGAGLLIGYR
jgi:hypothetical protein